VSFFYFLLSTTERTIIAFRMLGYFSIGVAPSSNDMFFFIKVSLPTFVAGFLSGAVTSAVAC